MRSKKLAVRFGLVSVLLMSLSAAAATFLCATPDAAVTDISWRGGLKLTFSCKNPADATIRLTYAPEGKVAATPTTSSYIYQRGYFLITQPCMFKARAYKSGWDPSFIRVVRFVRG